MPPPPIDGAEFARLIGACGPFESTPDIAVAVSGGPDSLALTLLLKVWLDRAGGRLLALTVDHGLRADSAREAREVAAFCAERGIDHRTLRWSGRKPASGVQAAARAARHALLEAACREEGIFHLCLAHHADDQAETFLLRLESGSGPLGLSGMARVSHTPSLRLLRPLLSIPKARLEATLKDQGIPWIDDPSNRAPAYRRSALRLALARLDAAGVAAGSFTDAAAKFAATRRLLEEETARLLAAGAAIYPAGYAWIQPAAFRAAPKEIARGALQALLRSLSGSEYPPRSARLEALLARVLTGRERGSTLSGCRILPRTSGLLLIREMAAIETVSLAPGETCLWDGRFRVALEAQRDGFQLGPLGGEGWRQLAAEGPELRDLPIPAAVRPTLPALRCRGRLECVPHLGWKRDVNLTAAYFSCVFSPKNPVSSAPFTVA